MGIIGRIKCKLGVVIVMTNTLGVVVMAVVTLLDGVCFLWCIKCGIVRKDYVDGEV